MKEAVDINWKLLFWYVFFGLLHELSHAATAVAFSVHEGLFPDDFIGVICFLLKAIIGRAIDIPELQDKPYERLVVRHEGWIFSLVLAVALSSISRSGKCHQSDRNLAAWTTALEAITTDLLCLGSGLETTSKTLLFCGNFGVIMVNKAWVQAPDNGSSALDLLQKMVEVTMMRGAQTGGVVSWASRRPKRTLLPTNTRSEYYSIRSRVVNGKRTDLSVLLRAKVEKDAFEGGRIKSGIRGFFGHTRFATSSISTFEGTHPHQWCPGYDWRVYSVEKQRSTSPKAARTNIENFITHNGDLDFFQINGHYADLGTVQKWLEKATGVPMPCSVDSAAIAGLIDIIRSAGSFGLSARYALLLALRSSGIDASGAYPGNELYERIGIVFEPHLLELCQTNGVTIHDISGSKELRQQLVRMASADVYGVVKSNRLLARYISIDEEAVPSRSTRASNFEFVEATVEAFFDNDLMHSTRIFMENAKGSFGLMVTCSLDAARQICIAARGQTMSVGFFPETGLICYGSEQAAVKAGLDFQPLNGKTHRSDRKFAMAMSRHQPDRFSNDTARMDLDDLAGEVCLIDWGEEDIENKYFVSQPNRHYPVHQVLRKTVNIVLHHESVATDEKLYSRMTLLRGHELVKPLPHIEADPILQDINDIPRICKAIQDDWQTFALNRMTAWHLRRCLVKRLNEKIAGRYGNRSDNIDILVTGCEVSLWLAEQFASDLKKAFPLLGVTAISSNKLLGVFGQTVQIPATNFSISQQTCHLDNTIVIIVSHSGGTFAPLACANLLQSETQSIFVVASEWDTQIGKQLRNSLSADDWGSRIFSTDVGVRPAEPCSVSVAATHQLLTQIFEFISLTILGKREFRQITNAVINETDLKILERCNRDSIYALVKTVGVGVEGEEVSSQAAQNLRDVGRLWSDHVLENARAYVMSILYIVLTVTIGYAPVSGFTTLIFGEGYWLYFARFLDSLVYIFLPQINVLILRVIQRRNIRHRMTTRTIAIGDVPWVAQAADAFLSKIFACSYSIAGVNVLSGNPADHFVHRHTHRVVRGTLLACGRPDGRLSALTSTEAAVCLSVNQASSIQSIGGTCESVTIGHNPFSLSLTKRDIFLRTSRPSFMCEKIVESKEKREPLGSTSHTAESHLSMERTLPSQPIKPFSPLNRGLPRQNSSPHFLLGVYMGWAHDALRENLSKNDGPQKLSHQDVVIQQMIAEKQRREKLKQLFKGASTDEEQMALDQFLAAAQDLDLDYSSDQLPKLFELDEDGDGDGTVDFKKARRITGMRKSTVWRKLDTKERSGSASLSAEFSSELYFGEDAKRNNPDASDFEVCENQQLSMELYESRIASLQRFVAFTVMFHELGSCVQRFFPRISFGFLGYRTDRSHSIMRIATTASPISGADVRERIKTMRLEKTIRHSVDVISSAWHNRRAQVARDLLRSHSSASLMRQTSRTSLFNSNAQSASDTDHSSGRYGAHTPILENDEEK